MFCMVRAAVTDLEAAQNAYHFICLQLLYLKYERNSSRKATSIK